MLTQLALIALGVLILYLGGEVLVRSVTELAQAFRISPFVVAFTVVAFGTSAPELAASVAFAIENQPQMALGNIVGSNITNIGLILGIAALVSPLELDRGLLRREMPFLIGTAIVMVGFGLTGRLVWLQAILLLAALGLFLWVLFRTDSLDTGEIPALKEASKLRGTLGALLGLGLLAVGAEVLVGAAEALARALGVSEYVIALLLIAFGTSVPELASCLVAASRKQSSIILGNIIGSNVFNTLLILPVTMLIRSIPVETSYLVDLLITLGFSLILGILFIGRRLGRVGGALLFLSYLTFVGFAAAR